MLPKKKRLNTAIFEKVINTGKTLYSELFIVKFIKDKSLLRFAVSVPKKIAETAVLRNKIRRRIYSAISSFEELSMVNMKILFIAKSKIINMNIRDIKSDIKEIFVKLGLLK